MIKSASSTFLPATESRVDKPERKIPIGWTILGASALSLVIWYQVIVIAYKFIEHFMAGGGL